MGLLIDATVFIDHERGRLELSEHVPAGSTDEMFVSVVTASELFHGVHRADGPARRSRRSAFVEAVLSEIPVLGIDLGAARAHAQIWADLASAGNVIGVHDMWMAATALSRGLTVVSANERDFARVPGLMLDVWGPRA